MAAKSALEVSCRRLGGLFELLERFDMPEEGFQGRMERSWMPLGALLGPRKEVLNGSWPLQEEFQEEAKRVQNRVQEAIQATNCETLIFAESTKVPGYPFRDQNRNKICKNRSLGS